MPTTTTLPDGTKVRRTTYGEVCLAPSGFVSIVANGNETYMWAHKAGNVWPCSDLSSHPVEIAIEANGDLVDYEGPDALGDELSAYISDMVSFIVDAHPAMRRATTHEGVTYFPDFYAARDVASAEIKGHPGWRVVAYERGHAIQYYPSGPYYPELQAAS